MSHDEIDRILTQQDELIPSSGFTSSVMDAVLRNASEPASIKFPWKLAAIVLFVCVCLLVALWNSNAQMPALDRTSAGIGLAWMIVFGSVFYAARFIRPVSR